MKRLPLIGALLFANLASASPGVNETEASKIIDNNVVVANAVDINSPKESLRKRIFGNMIETRACQQVQIHPKGGIDTLDKDLDTFLKDLIGAIQSRKELALQPLFHKRLNIPIPAITETFSRVDSLLGPPLEVSIYRLWALNTVDGSTKGIDCSGEGITIYPQYGYPLQFGLWLQLMGKNELGRIFVSIVPADGRWNIGVFHSQQWTHTSMDGSVWLEEGKKSVSKELKEAAFVKFDLAQKLLDGGGFIELAQRSEAIEARDRLMSKADWEQSIKKILSGFDVIYSSSLLVLDGAGILTRLQVPEELSMVAIKEKCNQVAKKIRSTPWGADLGGLRCAFNLPTEDPKKDGAMGGIYLSFSELK